MCRDEFAKHGMDTDYVQQNTSGSVHRGTVRGMHYQLQPHTEAKLVMHRRGHRRYHRRYAAGISPTYLKHERFELSQENRRQLYVPRGFASIPVIRSDNAEVNYLVSAPYRHRRSGGCATAIRAARDHWPLPVSVISDKDASWPLLQAGAPGPF